MAANICVQNAYYYVLCSSKLCCYISTCTSDNLIPILYSSWGMRLIAVVLAGVPSRLASV